VGRHIAAICGERLARCSLELRTSPSATEADVLDWCVGASTALCRAPMTGEWRAVVYLP